jgi:hypothetical protein
VSTVPLPAQPSLERLRKHARRLQRAVRAGEPAALALAAAHLPGGAPADRRRFALSAAQLVTARRHGFAGWPALKRHIETLERYHWDPGPPADEDADGLPARFCRLACLSYQDDGPARWARAGALIAAHPELSGADIWTAAAAGDLDAVARLLDADPALAVSRGGPYACCPLFYLAYSRADPGVDAAPVLAIARRLLDAGADPDEGYLWHGLPTPFTLLTGAFGHGELGPENQPPHPHASALARVLLEAGADPNDGQALYNRMFEPDDDHLELMLDHGLGSGDGGPWKARMGHLLDSPSEMLSGQLGWAVAHDQLARVRLLVEHGADIATRDEDGHTPLEVASGDDRAARAADRRRPGRRRRRVSRHRPQRPAQASHAASARSAAPRWLIASFCAGSSWAIVRPPNAEGSNTGS